MDPYTNHQQQSSSSSYDPSQPYNQSYYNNQQYPYNNTQYYIDPNYQYPNDASLIHPPGVPFQPDPTHLDYTHYTQVNAPFVHNLDSSQQWQGTYEAALQTHLVIQTAQPQYSGAGGTDINGAGRGHFGPRLHGSASFRNSRRPGRGRSRSGIATSNSLASKGASGSQQPTVQGAVCPPAKIIWCELCRVDCNTAEILEQHKNGKKHKKNLKLQEDLQKNNIMLVRGPSEQVAGSEQKLQDSYPTVKVEQSNEKKLPEEILSTQTATNATRHAEQKEMATADKTEELASKSGDDNYVPRGQGLKRRMKGGRGGKGMKSHDGSRRPVEASKPKEIIPLICEMCNAKCDTPTVFDSHLKGKKHLANAKRFQEQQEAALQVLYPALQALIPTLQALGQLNANNASNPFTPQLPQQNIHGSQGFIEPGSSTFSQRHSSVPGPFANAVSAPISETNEQQTSMLEGRIGGINKSQDEPLQFGRLYDAPVGSSVVASQSTPAEAVANPDGKIVPTDQDSSLN